jgi:hypothetical protein
MRMITARYPSRCQRCGEQILPGDRIAYSTGSEYHAVCPKVELVSLDKVEWKLDGVTHEVTVHAEMDGGRLILSSPRGTFIIQSWNLSKLKRLQGWD